MQRAHLRGASCAIHSSVSCGSEQNCAGRDGISATFGDVSDFKVLKALHRRLFVMCGAYQLTFMKYTAPFNSQHELFVNEVHDNCAVLFECVLGVPKPPSVYDGTRR